MKTAMIQTGPEDLADRYTTIELHELLKRRLRRLVDLTRFNAPACMIANAAGLTRTASLAIWLHEQNEVNA